MKHRLVAGIGFLLLSITVVALLVFAITQAQQHPQVMISGTQVSPGVIGSVIVIGLLLGTLIEMAFEVQRLADVTLASVICRHHGYNALSVVAGALLTLLLSVDVGLGAVTASALVGLIAALVVPDYAVPAYCGSFVGMTSIQLLFSYEELAIAAVIAAVIYVLSACTFAGIGGKLGTIAFAGTMTTAWILGRPFIAAPMPDMRTAMLIVGYAVMAAVLTFWVNVKLGHGAVMASAVVGLIGGLVLPQVYLEIGGTLAVVVFCASFAGMSSGERFPRGVMMWIVGLVTGLIFVYSTPLGGGAGGKLGTIAFSASLAVRGFYDLARRRIARLNRSEEAGHP
jgi:hypothetical protein